MFVPIRRHAIVVFANHSLAQAANNAANNTVEPIGLTNSFAFRRVHPKLASPTQSFYWSSRNRRSRSEMIHRWAASI